MRHTSDHSSRWSALWARGGGRSIVVALLVATALITAGAAAILTVNASWSA